MVNVNTSVIVLLGYKNYANGELHPIARQRADHAFALARGNDLPLICTGGFGDKFNQSPSAHGVLLQKYMEQRGLATHRFLPHAPSQNTYEDGLFCAQIIATQNISNILLVTSDFHIQRGFLWLNHFCPEPEIICHPAKTLASESDIQSFLAHEAQAIARFYEDFPDTPALRGNLSSPRAP